MKYDIAVIGGGPAGMMAAGKAGELGARVVLIEKNSNLGVKLLISGGGRCNITNNTSNTRELVNKFGKNGSFLFSTFNKFGVTEVIDFFESRGVKTKVETNNKVFPVSDRSIDVLNVLIKYLKKSQVEIKTNIEVKKIIQKNNKIEKIILSNNEEIVANKFIICTGGKSYPKMGSTGDGYVWAKQLGHTVTKLFPALTPVIIKEKFIKELEGLSLKDVEISLYKNSKKIDSKIGEAIFTFNGLSGPVILNMSKNIAQEPNSKIIMQIDFNPKLDFIKLDEKLQKDFQEASNKMLKNGLDKLLPQRLVSVIISLSGISPEKKVNLITKEERKKIAHLLKEFKLEVSGVVGYSKATTTSGGIALNEINPKTMQSKIIDNLYFAGEVLDLDAPTGGYNLQGCWSTGYVAGESAGAI